MSLALLVVSYWRKAFSLVTAIAFVVKVAVQLVEHGGLTRDGGRSRMRIQRGWLDVVDGCSGVYSNKEVTSCVGGALLAFDSELGRAEGCFPRGPVFGAGVEVIPVRALFWEADG